LELNYRTYGEGQPLIILHGLFGSLDNWLTLGKKFSKSFKVYLVDQRNHGRSFHSEDFSYDIMADDIYSLIIKENLQDIVILGHSMGGKTAMRFTQKYPHIVEKLIVADIGPKEYPMHHNHIIKALNSIDLNVVKSRKQANEIMASYIPESGIQQFLLKNLYWIEKDQLAWKINLSVISAKISEVIAETARELILTKTLFLSGENSDYILVTDYADIEKYFPNSEIEIIENAAHWIHADNPEAFYTKVITFIS
jgi:pimeloyl-ACP methyl ester carboxylesterase